MVIIINVYNICIFFSLISVLDKLIDSLFVSKNLSEAAKFFCF